MGKYRISETNKGQFWWVLKAANGQTLITSGMYTTKQACQNGIDSSKKAVAESNFDRKMSVKNEAFFNQIADNYQVLGTSEMYSSESARETGIQSVKTNAPTATVEDQT